MAMHKCAADKAALPLQRPLPSRIQCRRHIARASSGGAAERHAVARHRIAAGDEARRAEEPAVATPKMICALEGRHSQIQRNIIHANDFAHCGAPPGRGRICRLPPRVRALRRSPGAILCLAPRGASSHLRCLSVRGYGHTAMTTPSVARIPRGRHIARASSGEAAEEHRRGQAKPQRGERSPRLQENQVLSRGSGERTNAMRISLSPFQGFKP